MGDYETDDESKILSGSVESERNHRQGCCKVPVSPLPVLIPLCAYLFVYANGLLASADLTYNKVCYNHFHNISLCTNTTFSQNHPLLQGEATSWNNYVSLIQLVPAVVANLLLSSYCDKKGHKLPMLLPIVGTLVASLWLTVISNPRFIDWPLSVLLVYGLLNSLLGSFPMMLMSAFSYISAASRPTSRHIYLGLGEASLTVGVFIASLTNGPIIDNWGLDVLSYINVGFSAVTVAVVIILVPEIYKETAHQYGWKEVLKPHHILDSFKCIFRPRPGKDRFLLNASLTIYTSTFITVQAYTSLNFLYFAKEEGMTLTNFSIFNSVVYASKVLGPLILWIGKKLKFNMFDVAVFCLTSYTAGYILLSMNGGVSYLQWIGVLLMSGQLGVFAVLRDFQVSIVDKDENGKLFAYDSMIQILCSTVMALAINSLYGWSVTFWPELTFSVCGLIGVFALAMLSFLIIYTRLK